MLIVIAVIIFYFFKLKKNRIFLKYGILAFIYFNILGYLLHVDGPVGELMKELTKDGPLMAVYALFVIVMVWGGTGILIRLGVKKASVDTANTKIKETTL